MNRFAENFFFRPNSDFGASAPALYILSVSVFVLVVIGFLFYLARLKRTKNMELKRFQILAKRYALSRKEELFVLRLAKRAQYRPLYSILTNPEKFEKSVRSFISKDHQFEKKILTSIREKLFGRALKPDELIRSTHNLMPGIRLFMKYLDYKDNALWGHLVDIEREGMIVVVPSYHEIHIPLRPNTRLEITAFIPNHTPVVFRTWVQSVIPGPRKMVILGHSSFVLERSSVKENFVTPPVPAARIKKELYPNTSTKRTQHLAIKVKSNSIQIINIFYKLTGGSQNFLSRAFLFFFTGSHYYQLIT